MNKSRFSLAALLVAVLLSSALWSFADDDDDRRRGDAPRAGDRDGKDRDGDDRDDGDDDGRHLGRNVKLEFKLIGDDEDEPAFVLLCAAEGYGIRLYRSLEDEGGIPG